MLYEILQYEVFDKSYEIDAALGVRLIVRIIYTTDHLNGTTVIVSFLFVLFFL